jgi:hypothetical protein
MQLTKSAYFLSVDQKSEGFELNAIMKVDAAKVKVLRYLN